MADELNIQVANEGFGSYLEGILPKDIAIACGAFSATMQQVRNILSVDFEKFAQVAASIETTKGLSQVNGTDVPVNLPLATQGLTKTAIGSGPDGAYTMSDFFGCMSGLPYLWGDIQGGILGTQTTKLSNIYLELFLAVTWERAIVGITQSTYNVEIQPYIPPTYDPLPPYGILDPGQPRIDDWYYTVSSTLEQDGGGYGRGTAPVPTIVFSPNNCGASATCTIGTNNADAASMGGGTFGRVTSYSFNPGSAYKYTTTSVNSYSPPATPTPPTEYVTIQSAPTATLAVLANGQRSTSGTNTAGTRRDSTGGTTVLEAGWPSPMNTVVQAYITQANTEIAVIRTTKPYKCVNLNTVYNAAGTQLVIEQRARFTGIPPVPTTGFGDVSGRDDFLNIYPTALHNFVDSIPSLSQDTRPHMSAQTLEAISNLSLPGGQSIIAMMRQERNAARLQEIGVELDNNIPGKIEPNVEKLLITNGTVPIGTSGIAITGVNGNSNNSVTTYTVPSVLITKDDTGNLVAPIPSGFLDPELNLYLVTNPNFNDTGATNINESSPIDEIINLGLNNTDNQNLLGPALNGTGPRSVLKPGNIGNGQPGNQGGGPGSNTSGGQGGLGGNGLPRTTPKNVNPINIQTGSNKPITLKQAIDAARNQFTGAPIAPVRVGARLPVGNGSPYDTGIAIEPGSLAGSKAKDLLPTNLNATYTSGVLTPAVYSVSEAIDEVIKCNCDCWVD